MVVGGGWHDENSTLSTITPYVSWPRHIRLMKCWPAVIVVTCGQICEEGQETQTANRGRGKVRGRSVTPSLTRLYRGLYGAFRRFGRVARCRLLAR